MSFRPLDNNLRLQTGTSPLADRLTNRGGASTLEQQLLEALNNPGGGRSISDSIISRHGANPTEAEMKGIADELGAKLSKGELTPEQAKAEIDKSDLSDPAKKVLADMLAKLTATFSEKMAKSFTEYGKQIEQRVGDRRERTEIARLANPTESTFTPFQATPTDLPRLR